MSNEIATTDFLFIQINNQKVIIPGKTKKMSLNN